jgi:uncharacterized protein with FMN-binding domain
VKLTVKNGQAELYFELTPVTVGPVVGYLGELYSVSDHGDATEVRTPATVDSVYDDVWDVFNDPEEGTDEVMKGREYPKGVSIPVELNAPITWIRVYIPLMEGLTPGTGSQYARVLLDWNGLDPLVPIAPEPVYVPGIYQGVGQGFDNGGGADVEVFVQTSETEIVKIFAGAHNQTPVFWNMAFSGAYGGQGVPAKILENQGLDDVDVVSGATYSSNGIKQAVAGALENAVEGDAAVPDEMLSLPAVLWQANADQPSMMNGMLIPAAEVRRYGAEYTAVFQIGPTSIYGLSVNGSDAQNLRMANSNGDFVVPPITE